MMNFLYRNRFTEPMLVILLVITGAWLFIRLVYHPYMAGWVIYYRWERFRGVNNVRPYYG